MLKGRVLIVEDEPGVRLGMRTYLETYGYEIEEADTCAAALGADQTVLPDVIVVDYSLPDGTALDLMAQLKSAAIEVPVVLITGHGSIELGGDGHQGRGGALSHQAGGAARPSPW